MTKTPFLASLLLSGLLCGVGAGGAGAQTAQQLDRLSKLESQAAALQGSRIEVAQLQVAQTQVAQVNPSLAADFEVRLQQLERMISELNGRYEESTYQLSQLKDRLERVNSDIDFRLKDLESKGGGTPSAGSAFGPSKGNSAASAPAAAATAPAKAPEAPAKAPEKPSSVAALPANAGPDKQYEHAFELLSKADYERSEKAFQDFLAKNKNHQLAGNAQYWLGESYYARNKYAEAAQAFAEGVAKYPKNSKAADNLLKLGMSLQQLNQKKDACTAFTQLMTKFPEASANVKRRADAERRKLNCPG